MDFFVAVTDNDWFDHLAALKPDEVNSWRPSGKGFSAIPIGVPFLFKLHSPLDYISGGGFFVRYERLPLSLAWDAFEQKNGAQTLGELRRLVLSHRSGNEIDPQIGCVILNEPFSLPQDKWIPVPENWSRNIVTGKTYSTDKAIGRELWDRVVEVSRRLKDDFDNGKDYYPLHGKRLVILPRDIVDYPRRAFLSWHNENKYLG